MTKTLWREGYEQGIKEKEDQFRKEHRNIYSCLTKKQIKEMEFKVRKQTLSEVLKKLTEYSEVIDGDLVVQDEEFREWLEQKLKEAME